jgi:ABC-type lipoprotein release transport system permease subunit
LIRIAWSNLRSASGRLFAATIAIAVSVAFIVAALLFSQTFGDTLRDQVRSQWAGADVAITASQSDRTDPAKSSPLDESLAKSVAELDGAKSAQLTESGFVSVTADGTTVSAMPTNVPENQDEPITGSAPDADDELMLHEADAQTLGLGVGDELTMKAFDGAGGSGSDDRAYTVSGIMPGSSASAMGLYLTDAGLQTVPSELTADSVRVVAADGTDRGDLAEAVRTTVVAEAGSADALTVQTVDQVVDEQLEAMSDSTNVLNTVGLAFGLLAAGVAALVISNTFNVLVASRTRVLALFRAVGATRRQVRGAAVIESLSLGIIGSVVGVGLGLGLGWGLAAAARAFWMPEFAQMSVSPLASRGRTGRRHPRHGRGRTDPGPALLPRLAHRGAASRRRARRRCRHPLVPCDARDRPRRRRHRPVPARCELPVRALRHPRLLRPLRRPPHRRSGVRAAAGGSAGATDRADHPALAHGQTGRTVGEHRGRTDRLDDGCPADRDHPGHGRRRRFGQPAAHPRTGHRRGHTRRPRRDRKRQRRRFGPR